MINDMPAFPEGDFYNEKQVGQKSGMTLRDYFAAKAMQATVASGDYSTGSRDGDILAEEAYAIADAMLAARDKPSAE